MCKDTQGFFESCKLFCGFFFVFCSVFTTFYLMVKEGCTSKIKEKRYFSLYFARFSLPLRPI